jgi:hypothetical protein
LNPEGKVRNWTKFARQMSDIALQARAATRAKNGDKKHLLPYLDQNGKPKPGSPLVDAPPAKGG